MSHSVGQRVRRPWPTPRFVNIPVMSKYFWGHLVGHCLQTGNLTIYYWLLISVLRFTIPRIRMQNVSQCERAADLKMVALCYGIFADKMNSQNVHVLVIRKQLNKTHVDSYDPPINLSSATDGQFLDSLCRL